MVVSRINGSTSQGTLWAGDSGGGMGRGGLRVSETDRQSESVRERQTDRVSRCERDRQTE